MQAILVPTDFSPVARNAALYAFQLAEQLKVTEVILFNAYEAPVNIDPMITPVILPDIETLRKGSEETLERFRKDVAPFCSMDIRLSCVARYAHLSVGLDEVCHELNAGLIVMGVTGASMLEEKLLGSSALSVAKNGTVPVIIVPPDAKFAPLKEIMLACDLKQVVKTTPIQPIRDLLDGTGAELFVLHVNQEGRALPEGTSYESLMLDTLLQGYDPTYLFEEASNFIDAVNKVALERKIDLIIAIPKKQGLFAGLFHSSSTKKLAYHSHIPLMVIHE